MESILYNILFSVYKLLIFYIYIIQPNTPIYTLYMYTAIQILKKTFTIIPMLPCQMSM